MSHPPTSTSESRTRDPRLVPGSVYGLFLLVWVFFLMATTMGASAGVPEAENLLPVVAAYPLVALASTVASRRAVRAGRLRAARVWNLLPMPWVLAGTGVLVWTLS